MRPTLLLAACMGLFPVSAGAAPPKVTSDSWPGVQSHRIATKDGSILIRLPADMRAGDTISGTVIAEPSGKTPAAQAANRDRLSGYVYELGDAKARRAGAVIVFTIAAGTVAKLTPLAIKTVSGEVVSSALPLMIGAQTKGPSPGAAPVMGQSGRPMEIPGHFDGNASNTLATLGGQPVEIIAESPRNAVLRNPDAKTGPVQLRVADGSGEVSGPYRVVDVGMAVGKSNLKRGEKTTLNVTVDGLDSAQPTPPILSLASNGPINLEGGNAQSIALRPDANGQAVLTRTITGIAPGAFDIAAQVNAQMATPQRDPLFPDALDMNGIDTVLHLLGLTAAMNDEAREALLKATLAALRQRLSDATDKATREWLKKKIGIVETAMDRLGIGH